MDSRVKKTIILILALIFLLLCSCTPRSSQLISLDPTHTWVVILSGVVESSKDPSVRKASSPDEHFNARNVEAFFANRGFPNDHLFLGLPLTTQVFENAIGWVKTNVRPGDLLAAFVFTHGSWRANAIGPMSWDPDFVEPWRNLTGFDKFLYLGTCYSGAFAESLSDNRGIVISECGNNELAWSGFTVEGLPIIGSPFLHFFWENVANPEADLNRDGVVSIIEAFRKSIKAYRDYMCDVVYADTEYRFELISSGFVSPLLVSAHKYPNPVIIRHGQPDIALTRLKGK